MKIQINSVEMLKKMLPHGALVEIKESLGCSYETVRQFKNPKVIEKAKEILEREANKKGI